MSMQDFTLQVYVEDGIFYDGPCYEVIIPCVDGEKAFLANHEEAVYAVYNGIMKFLIPTEEAYGTDVPAAIRDKDIPLSVWREAVIGKGVASFSNNLCSVLAETCEWPDEIDEKRAIAAYERAQEKMQKEISMREYKISQMAMARATARIRALSRREK